MSKETKEDEGGCFSALFFLLVVGGLIYWGYTELKDADFVQKIIKSDTELIVGKWKIVGGTIYSQGETKRVKLKQNGDNFLFGTIENPAYFIFTNENEFIRTQSNGKKIYLNYRVSNEKIITPYQEMEIIELSTTKLVFKEEFLMQSLPGKEHLLGKMYYTFRTIKVN